MPLRASLQNDNNFVWGRKNLWVWVLCSDVFLFILCYKFVCVIFFYSTDKVGQWTWYIRLWKLFNFLLQDALLVNIYTFLFPFTFVVYTTTCVHLCHSFHEISHSTKVVHILPYGSLMVEHSHYFKLRHSQHPLW